MFTLLQYQACINQEPQGVSFLIISTFEQTYKICNHGRNVLRFINLTKFSFTASENVEWLLVTTQDLEY